MYSNRFFGVFAKIGVDIKKKRFLRILRSIKEIFGVNIVRKFLVVCTPKLEYGKNGII